MDISESKSMANMTSQLQSQIAITKTDNDSDVHYHANYMHANFNEYDHSILSDIDPDIHHNNCGNSKYYNEHSFNNVFKKSNELSIFHLNIRSIPANFSKLRAQLDTLHINFKIIALSETAINDHDTAFNIPGYNVEQDFRPKRKGGGVALFIANNLQYRIRADLQLGENTNSIFVEIDRTHLNSKYNTIIGCIYRPPSYSLKSFNALLTSRLSILHNEKKQLYIAGDFNVNIDPLVKNDINTQTFKNIFSSNFLFPLIDKPTRVTCHSATIIDNIFSNASDIANTSRSGILRLSISDHYAVFCVNTSINVKADKQTVTKRNYSQKSISKFTKSLTNQSWISINILDVQSAFSWFQRVIDLHFEEHFPKQTFTMTYKTRLPWLTEKLRTQIKEKNAMHTQVILNPSNTLLNSEYKRLRNELTSSLRNCELQYYSNKLELNKSDLKKK